MISDQETKYRLFRKAVSDPLPWPRPIRSPHQLNYPHFPPIPPISEQSYILFKAQKIYHFSSCQ